MEPNQERDIVLRVLGGEREAYALLVDEYKGPIFNLAYRMTGSYEDASDLAQETFARAYANLKKFHTDRRFFTWLYTVSLNIIRNHLKKIVLFREASDKMVLGTDVNFGTDHDGAGNPEERLLETEQLAKLVTCLRKLPLDQREAVILRFYQGLPFAEMAGILEITESAVKMRVYRALEKLKKGMAKQ